MEKSTISHDVLSNILSSQEPKVSNVFIKDYDFSKQNLRNVVFTNCEFINCNFANCKFPVIVSKCTYNNCNFYMIDAQNTAFSMCEFLNIKQERACYLSASFSNCHFHSVNFSNTFLNFTEFFCSHFFGTTRFEQADLTNGTFAFCMDYDRKISFNKAYIRDMRIVNCNFSLSYLISKDLILAMKKVKEEQEGDFCDT